MLKATVVREFGEVMRQGRKVEDYSWTVTFFKDDERVDEHYYKRSLTAYRNAELYKLGQFSLSEFGGVQF